MYNKREKIDLLFLGKYLYDFLPLDEGSPPFLWKFGSRLLVLTQTHSVEVSQVHSHRC